MTDMLILHAGADLVQLCPLWLQSVWRIPSHLHLRPFLWEASPRAGLTLSPRCSRSGCGFKFYHGTDLLALEVGL